MCLIAKTNTPLIAKEDIVCYKYLIRPCFLYRTPIWYAKVHPFLWKLFDKPFKAKGREEITSCENCYRIEGGFIHSYQHQDINYLPVNNLIQFKCIIPKGTEYFEDVNNNEYASKQIKFIKKI